MTATLAPVVRTEEVMGTVVSFAIYPSVAADDELIAAVEASCVRLHDLDAIFSAWRADSTLSLFRQGAIGPEQVPLEMHQVTDLCKTAWDLSQGWFDPWAMPGGFDPTGLVKGWAVQQALGMVLSGKVKGAMVNGGGDIAVHGAPPGGGVWRVGIRHPWRPAALACVLEVAEAVATSGTYERGEHFFNPKPWLRVPATASATVTGPCLAIADALATALAVGGELAFGLLESLDGYEAYRVGADGSEQATKGIVFA